MKRCDLTPCTKLLSESIEIVVDKMHMAGHTDQWCHKYCDPRKFRTLKMYETKLSKANTNLARNNTGGYWSLWTAFSWLFKYAKMTRRMNRNTFVFFLLYIYDLHNVIVQMLRLYCTTPYCMDKDPPRSLRCSRTLRKTRDIRRRDYLVYVW